MSREASDKEKVIFLVGDAVRDGGAGCVCRCRSVGKGISRNKEAVLHNGYRLQLFILTLNH